MEGFFRKVNFKCAGHVVFVNIYNRSVIKSLKMYIYMYIYIYIYILQLSLVITTKWDRFSGDLIFSYITL